MFNPKTIILAYCCCYLGQYLGMNLLSRCCSGILSNIINNDFTSCSKKQHYTIITLALAHPTLREDHKALAAEQVGRGGCSPPTFDIGGAEPLQNEADVTSRRVNVLKQESQLQRLRLGLHKRERSSDKTLDQSAESFCIHFVRATFKFRNASGFTGT